jgi:PHP family Zn ribbon phosphoesterase
LSEHGEFKKLKFISNSDAHALYEIDDAKNYIEIKNINIKDFLDILTKKI